MPERKSNPSPMGDIINSTRQRIEQSGDPADRLKNLVAATPAPKPAKPAAAPAATERPAQQELPSGYFPQVTSEVVSVTPKRRPQRGPLRDLHISMRISLPERDRLVRWCEARNLSLPDGVMALIDIAERQEG